MSEPDWTVIGPDGVAPPEPCRHLKELDHQAMVLLYGVSLMIADHGTDLPQFSGSHDVDATVNSQRFSLTCTWNIRPAQQEAPPNGLPDRR
jgi:hypothetical protein